MDGTNGNSWHHHSWVVTFEWLVDTIAEPPVPPVITPPIIVEPPVGTGDLEYRVAELEAKMRVVESFIGAKG